jgi:signal transduction histidine kinase
MRLVFRHLINNALKYKYHGTPVIIRMEDRENQIRILFSNRGIPVESGDESIKMEHEWRSPRAWLVRPGFGRGLMVSKRIVEAHHGLLTLSPTNPEGITTVELRLPLADRSE